MTEGMAIKTAGATVGMSEEIIHHLDLKDDLMMNIVEVEEVVMVVAAEATITTLAMKVVMTEAFLLSQSSDLGKMYLKVMKPTEAPLRHYSLGTCPIPLEKKTV